MRQRCIGKHKVRQKVLAEIQMSQQCSPGTNYIEQYHCVVDLGKRISTVEQQANYVPLLSVI